MGWFSSDDSPPRPRACDKIRKELLDCLKGSRCCSELGKSPRECLFMRGTEFVPEECFLLRYSLFECKRSLIDMRQRFRGRKGQVFPGEDEEDQV